MIEKKFEILVEELDPKQYGEDMVENDMWTPEEAGFMRGYNEAD